MRFIDATGRLLVPLFVILSTNWAVAEVCEQAVMDEVFPAVSRQINPLSHVDIDRLGFVPKLNGPYNGFDNDDDDDEFSTRPVSYVVSAEQPCSPNAACATSPFAYLSYDVTFDGERLTIKHVTMHETFWRKGVFSALLRLALNGQPRVKFVQGWLAEENEKVIRDGLARGLNLETAVKDTPAYKVFSRFGFPVVVSVTRSQEGFHLVMRR